MREPVLTAEDRRLWHLWSRTCLAWSRTATHHRRVEEARAHIWSMSRRCPGAYVAWSAGKDSTAMTHLVVTELGAGQVTAMSVKDDLDFPGEREYVAELSQEWGLAVDVVSPSFSLQEWLRDNSSRVEMGGDMHGRGAEFSEAAFYSVVDDYARSRGRPGVYLGLRKHESYGRMMNRNCRGPVYEKSCDEVVCQPLCDWDARDVFGYLLANGIEPLHVYRCLRMSSSPGRVRKGWWLPGASSTKGGAVWLKSYYPTLYRRLCSLAPGANRWA